MRHVRRAGRIALYAVALLAVACGGDEDEGTLSGGGDATEDAGGDLGAGLPDPGSEPDLTEEDTAPEEDAGPDTSGGETPDTAAPDTADVPPPCEVGAPCDDGDPCTKDDVCLVGHVCEGTPYSCSDGKGCTRDICDGAGGCSNPIYGDRCLIDGGCYEDGSPGPVPCIACVSPVSQTEWTFDDGQTCEDGNFCTAQDRCYGGECVAAQAKDCDDHNPCTDDACQPDKGCTHAHNERACDDGDACSVGDTCTNGACAPGPVYVSCDDGNPCTDDLCVGEGANPDVIVGCINSPNFLECSDGSVCTQGDRCEDTECKPGTDLLPCGDDNPCTEDLCHPEFGCFHKDFDGPCDDGDPCTSGDACSFGVCRVGPIATFCGDGNPCTVDSCDPASGGCVFAPDNGKPCSDGDACTLFDFCEAGVCKAGGSTVQCDDDNPCTDDHCGPDGTCVFQVNLAVCDDDDPCTKGDHCLEGACQPGLLPLSCSDQNPCTDTWCEPGEGCKTAHNDAPCSDKNACTVGDRCVAGQCAPGDTVAACSDGNPCTDEFCDSEKGCIIQANTLICDDGDPCTQGDQCQGGTCVGYSGECDDGNECTKEICVNPGPDNPTGCMHVPIASFECQPRIDLTYPPRGAMIYGPDPITVMGIVKVGGAGLKDLFINGFPVPVNANGTFAWEMQPAQGINILHAIASSKLGGQDTAVRSFAYSNEFIPNGGTVPNGIGIWLSQFVWDDNNTSDIDDIATVIRLILMEYDIPALIPSVLTSGQAGWCSYTVKTTGVGIGLPEVDLTPKNGALGFRVRYPNFYMGVKAEASSWFCFDISGSVSMDYIEVSGDLKVIQFPNSVQFQLVNEGSAVQNLDVNIDGIFGFLFNWIINFFEGDIEGIVEQQIVAQMAPISDALGGALNALAFDTSFDIPSFLGDQPPTTVDLKTKLTKSNFNQFGGFLELSTTVTTSQKGIPYNPLGSVGRANCLDTKVEFFDYLMQGELEIALKDDMINQVLFAAWYAGAFEIPLDQSILGDIDLGEFGVQLLDVSLSFMLPPVLSSCNYDQTLTMSIGDLRVHVSILLFGQPLEVDIFTSAVTAAELTIVEGVTGPEMAIEMTDVLFMGTEVGQLQVGTENAQGALEELMSQYLVPDFFTDLGGQALGSFPIPSIPLDGFSPAIPTGTAIELFLTKFYRLGGRSIMAGVAQ